MSLEYHTAHLCMYVYAFEDMYIYLACKWRVCVCVCVLDESQFYLDVENILAKHRVVLWCANHCVQIGCVDTYIGKHNNIIWAYITASTCVHGNLAKQIPLSIYFVHDNIMIYAKV